MASLGIWLVLLLSLAYLKSASVVTAEALGSMEIMEKPQRPRVFASAEELKSYLGKLQQYYSSQGRNRWVRERSNQTTS
jgi:hypothetical protein